MKGDTSSSTPTVVMVTTLGSAARAMGAKLSRRGRRTRPLRGRRRRAGRRAAASRTRRASRPGGSRDPPVRRQVRRHIAGRTTRAPCEHRERARSPLLRASFSLRLRSARRSASAGRKGSAPRRRSSSPVRLPFVFSSSIAMRSIVCRASGRFFSRPPVSGLRRLAEVHQRRVAERQDERREVDVRGQGVVVHGALRGAQSSRPPSAGCGMVIDSAWSAASGSCARCFSTSLSSRMPLRDVALANADVPLPGVDCLGVSGRHVRIGLLG